MLYHLTVTLPFYLFMHAGLFMVFRKAGVAGWKAMVPVYNVYIWLQLIGRPNWWLVWFMLPVLNFIMGIGMILDLLRSYGKHNFKDHALAVLFPWAYFLYLGFNKKDKYEGKWHEILRDLKEKKKNSPHFGDPRIDKSQAREWLDAILFAGTAALIIRTFLIEAFMIPTTSMEGSLKAGDFLFVSKFHYGVRLPMVPLSFPFVHNTLPFTSSTKSYVDWVTFPYSRLPGFKDIERNEIVVFNYPDDDLSPDVDALGPIEVTSMKQNYIKRCVGVPGDKLEIRSQQLMINDKPAWNPPDMQFSHYVYGAISDKEFEDMGLRIKTDNRNVKKPRYPHPRYPQAGNAFEVHMSEAKKAELEATGRYTIVRKHHHRDSLDPREFSESYVGPYKSYMEYKRMKEGGTNMLPTNQGPVSIDLAIMSARKGMMFPKSPKDYPWTIDNFGPVTIPAEGATVQLNLKNLPIYEKVIDYYEDHDLEVKGNQIFIDGKVATSYTFEMDYYWMMGDNRHASLDSRYWGFVPEDHIIGRPWFVLFSWEDGPRWGRTLNPVAGWEE